jgi:transglutaminase-like putative cysteine protease
VTAVGLPLCLLLPRPGNDPWDPLRLMSARQRLQAARLETGAASDLDLNLTGWVELDEEVVLVVTAEDAAGAPKLDLDPGQRWRGPVLDTYEAGRWESRYSHPTAFALQGMEMTPPWVAEDAAAGPVARGAPRRELMDLGPEKYFLTFEIEPRKAGALVLADPVVLRGPGVRAGENSWITLRRGEVPGPLFAEFEGTLLPNPVPGRKGAAYKQVTVPPGEPDLGPQVELHRLDYVDHLRRQPVPGLTAWARQLAERLASRPDSGFTRDDLALEPAPPSLAGDHPDGVLPPERWEKVARGLCAYLAHSPDYTYSLELRRQDWGIDPTLDFLRNVKEGHCSRYAGGLALTLRALGIPARIVTGYRGADGQGDGRYALRNSMYHAWVEVPVPRGPAGQEHWHWLALDPTPAGEAAAPPVLSLSRWWVKGRDAWDFFWKEFIVDYNAEQQEEMWSGLGSSLSQARGWRLPAGAAGVLLAAGAVLVAVRLAARLRRPRGAPREAAPVGFYRRLLAILARRRRLRPRPSQTPREFAEEARQALAGAAGGLASLPAEVAELLYRVRYGGVPLSEAEGRDVDRRLGDLDAALARR